MNTSTFNFFCSHCDQALKCETRHAGRQVQCPSCKEMVRIPNPPAGTGYTQVEPKAAQPWDTRAWGG